MSSYLELENNSDTWDRHKSSIVKEIKQTGKRPVEFYESFTAKIDELVRRNITTSCCCYGNRWDDFVKQRVFSSLWEGFVEELEIQPKIEERSMYWSSIAGGLASEPEVKGVQLTLF